MSHWPIVVTHTTEVRIVQTLGYSRILIGLAALAAAATVPAEDALQVRNARAFSTVPGQSVAVAYMTIESRIPSRIVSVQSEAADAVQIHAMSMHGGIMRMRRLNSVDLPAGRKVELAPGGVHLMFVGLKQPLRIGGTVNISLTVTSTAGGEHTVRLTVPVVDARTDRAKRHE
jgi:copper(I)-binding protein